MILPNKKDTIEISVEKKQYKEKFKFVGELKPKPNQRIFKLDIEKNIVSECDYVSKSKTISFLEAKYKKKLDKERTVIVKEGFDYVIKLNLVNAVKYFKKKYNNTNIYGVKKYVKQHKKHRKTNLYKN